MRSTGTTEVRVGMRDYSTRSLRAIVCPTERGAVWRPREGFEPPTRGLEGRRSIH